MASHLDLKARLDAVGVSDEIYVGAPSSVLAQVAKLVRSGRYPVCINIKGQPVNDTLIVVSLSALEAMPRTGFELADGD